MTDQEADVREAQRDFESALIRSEKHVMGVGFLKPSTLCHLKSEIKRLNLLEEKVRFILPVLEGLESGNYGGFTLEEVARSIRIILDSHSRERVKEAEALADQQP